MRQLTLLLSILFALNSCRAGYTDSLEDALTLIDDGRYQEAIPILQEVLPKLRNPSDQNLTRYVLGNAYQIQKQWEKAIPIYKVALENGFEIQDHLKWRIAQSYDALEDPANAVVWYRRLLEDHPSYSRASDARYRLAQAELELKNYSSALDVYKQSGVKKSRDALFLCAQAYEGLEDWEQAYRAYQQILTAKATDDQAQQAYERILIVTSKAVSIRPTRSERLQHARVLLASRQRTEARKILKKIIGTYRDKLAGQAVYLIGQSYAAQRKYDDAIREYAKIRDRYSASGYLTRSLYQTALVYRRKGQVTKSNQLLMNFVKTYAWSALADNALYEVGRTEQKRKRYKEAINAYKQLLRQYTRSSLTDDALWNVGWCYFKLKDFQQSKQTFQKLARKFPQTSTGDAAQYWVGKLYERLQQWEAAARTYAQIIDENDWYYMYRAETRLQQLVRDGKIERSRPSRTPLTHDAPEMLDAIQAHPLPQLPLLFRARAYDDALADLRSALSTAESQRASIYYYLIVCSEKARKFRQASLYAYRLSRLKGWRDTQGRLPESLFKRIYPFYYRQLVTIHAADSQLDPLFVAAMIREESRYQADIVSHAGAIGLMQLMPATAKDIASRLKIRNFRTSMLTRADISIRFGSWYMGKLMKQFKSPELVSGAYNGGPGRMQRWTKELALQDMDEFIEDVPITETRNHIKRVMHSYAVYKQVYGTGDGTL